MSLDFLYNFFKRILYMPLLSFLFLDLKSLLFSLRRHLRAEVQAALDAHKATITPPPTPTRSRLATVSPSLSTPTRPRPPSHGTFPATARSPAAGASRDRVSTASSCPPVHVVSVYSHPSEPRADGYCRCTLRTPLPPAAPNLPDDREVTISHGTP